MPEKFVSALLGGIDIVGNAVAPAEAATGCTCEPILAIFGIWERFCRQLMYEAPLSGANNRKAYMKLIG